MNTFKIDYDKKLLHVTFEGNNYQFDLTKGDVGDYWCGFIHNHKDYDINFYQEYNEESIATATIYDVVDGYINTDIDYSLQLTETIGNPNNYFKH